MEKLTKLTIVLGLLVLLMGGYVIAVELIEVTYDTPNTNDKIRRCGNNIDCWGALQNDSSFARFFTIIHEDGTVERIIAIEEYPITVTDPRRVINTS